MDVRSLFISLKFAAPLSISIATLAFPLSFFFFFGQRTNFFLFRKQTNPLARSMSITVLTISSVSTLSLRLCDGPTSTPAPGWIFLLFIHSRDLCPILFDPPCI